jgi:hypothetical protein
MRFSFVFILVAVTHISLFSQISELPYVQNFSSSFIQTGENIQFLDNWFGNVVAESNRIFQQSETFFSSPAALAVIPLSTFKGEIIVKLDMSSYSNVEMLFKAKSSKNGNENQTYGCDLTISTSIDEGTSWIKPIKIGSFPNLEQDYFQDFRYLIPHQANFKPSVWVKFTVSRGSTGSGTAAKLIIDNVFIRQSTDVIVLSDKLSLSFYQLSGVASASQSLLISAFNLTESLLISVPKPFEISVQADNDFSSSVLLEPVNNLLPETQLFVRMNGIGEGPLFESLTLSSNLVKHLEVDLNGEIEAVNATYPAPHNLSESAYVLQLNSGELSAGIYPEAMRFWAHNSSDPNLNTPFLSDYSCGYNYTSLSRFTISNSNGIMMINTNDSQFVGLCDGSNPEQTSGQRVKNGKVGAIVLAINTLDVDEVVVKWTARTITKNSRIFGLRMQYRVEDGSYNANSGWCDFEPTVEYINGATGNSEMFETPLPFDVHNRENVQLRWVYFHLEGTSGARAQIALEDVIVSQKSDLINIISNTNNGSSALFQIYPNPVSSALIHFSKPITGIVYDIMGYNISEIYNSSSLDVRNFAPGIYFVSTIDGHVAKFIKQ